MKGSGVVPCRTIPCEPKVAWAWMVIRVNIRVTLSWGQLVEHSEERYHPVAVQA